MCNETKHKYIKSKKILFHSWYNQNATEQTSLKVDYNKSLLTLCVVFAPKYKFIMNQIITAIKYTDKERKDL